jgi:hypothetical protein
MGKITGRHDRGGSLSGRVAECCESPEPRAVYRRGVVDRQWDILDLGDTGRDETSRRGSTREST